MRFPLQLLPISGLHCLHISHAQHTLADTYIPPPLIYTINSMAEEKVLPAVEEEAELEEEMEEEQPPQLGSRLTLERVAAAKNFIENHYRSHMKDMQKRRERLSIHTHTHACMSFSTYTYMPLPISDFAPFRSMPQKLLYIHV